MARSVEPGNIAQILSPRARMGRVVTKSVRVARHHPNMALGVAIIVVFAVVSLIAPLITSVKPTQINMTDRLTGPSQSYWFGTDGFGRDIYARTLYGGRISLAIGFSVGMIAIVAGALIGSVTGYFSKVDAVVMRVMDGLMAIPTILLAIALVAMLGATVQNVIIAISIADTPRAVRVARASVLVLKEQAFVEAARTIGAGHTRVLLRHIIPNLIAPLIVMGTFITASAILTEAYLSFLGAGTPPTTPSWGNVMAEGRGFIHKAMWVIFFPGLVLAIAVTAINLAGDGLRDYLDPRLRGQLH